MKRLSSSEDEDFDVEMPDVSAPVSEVSATALENNVVELSTSNDDVEHVDIIPELDSLASIDDVEQVDARPELDPLTSNEDVELVEITPQVEPSTSNDEVNHVLIQMDYEAYESDGSESMKKGKETNEDESGNSEDESGNSEDESDEQMEKSKILKDHQTDAIRFMIRNCIDQNSGCVLAHHMGLGKTITTIAFVNLIQNNCKKVLILTRKSIVQQWMEESKTHCIHDIASASNENVEYMQFPEKG